MFRTYCGEYLVSPIPLHYGFNVCSHGCFYCFANLNKPDRKEDIKQLVKYIKKYDKREENTVESWFLKHGYPVLMSNDTDPLAAINIDSFLSVHEIFYDRGIRMCYQTKGGDERGVKLMLSDKPTMVYISLTSDDNDLLRIAEPGAPNYNERIKLIGRFINAGHHVVVGINPFVDHWWINFPGVLSTLKKIGIDHIWVGSMHLNNNQLINMPQRQKDRFESEIYQAKKKVLPPCYQQMKQQVELMGFKVFSHGVSNTGGFWDKYFSLGFPNYPTIERFCDYLRAFEQPLIIEFADFNEWAQFGFPQFSKSSYRQFVTSIRGKIFMKTGIDVITTNMTDVNSYYWEIDQVPTPLDNDYLYLAVDNHENLITDDYNLPLLVYNSKRQKSVLFNIDKDRINFLSDLR